ncbi:MAG: hypothetical protein R2708_08555 [Vicinamibacterales bacterium]
MATTNAPAMNVSPSKTSGGDAATVARAMTKSAPMQATPMATVRTTGLGTRAARTLSSSIRPNIAKTGAKAATSPFMWVTATRM